MKYYEHLSKLQCFSKQDVVKLTGKESTARSMIFDYKQKGFIESVKHNLYVVISMDLKQPIASKYRIASSIKDGAYISHHTAFEYYGCANQVFHEVYVSGEKKFAKFEYDDITYRYIIPRLVTGIEAKEDNIRVTTIERTIIDSINDYDYLSGIEEVLRCIELIPYASDKKLLYYLHQYGKQVLYQKTGYILEHYKTQLRLSDDFFAECKKGIKNSVRYLYKGIKQSSNIYNKEWKLYVPKDLMQITTEGNIFDAPV
jgi:predicted transcriptional regulator of viral defense system